MNRNLSFISITLACLFGASFTQRVEARISLLAPWSVSNRTITPHGKMDQAVQFALGLEGVSPTGADMDAKFIMLPYQFNYGLLQNVEIGTSWGLSWVDRKTKSSQLGVSDFLLAGRYRFFDANPTQHSAGLDVEAALSLPTASFDKGLGSGAIGLLTDLGLVLPFDAFQTFFHFGYRINTENSDSIELGNIFSYGGGIQFPASHFFSSALWKDTNCAVELKGFNHARNQTSGTKTGAAADELYLIGSLLWDLSLKQQLNTSLLLGLTQDSSDLGLSLEFRF